MESKSDHSGDGKTYRVVWKHSENGEVIKGSVVYDSGEDAQGIAAELNKVSPEITHWVEEEQGGGSCQSGETDGPGEK